MFKQKFMQRYSDGHLIELALEGKQSAYKELYHRHVDGLFAFLRQFSDDRTTVADWVQETFITTFAKLRDFKAQSTFKTWLFRIGINQMKMDMRKWDRFRQSTTEDIEIDTPLNAHVEFQSVGDLISIREQVDALDDQKKVVFLLYEVEGYSHKEIAEIIGIKESSSRTILTRAKKDLRAVLAD